MQRTLALNFKCLSNNHKYKNLRSISNSSYNLFSNTSEETVTITDIPKQKVNKVKGKRPIIIQQRKRNTELYQQADDSKLNWRLIGSTILHRYPVITLDKEKWETDFLDICESNDDRRREYLLKQIVGTESDFIPEINPTEQEILESLPFEPASRVTEADKTNDRRSPNRRLQDSLYLIVKRNRTINPWQFPQGKIQTNENFRGTCERVLDRAVGRTNRWFISNAPIGHYCYSYPKEIQQTRNNFGAKIFYYRAQLIEGNIKLETKLYTDYAWIARDEVYEYFDKDTADFMSSLLPY